MKCEVCGVTRQAFKSRKALKCLAFCAFDLSDVVVVFGMVWLEEGRLARWLEISLILVLGYCCELVLL